MRTFRTVSSWARWPALALLSALAACTSEPTQRGFSIDPATHADAGQDTEPAVAREAGPLVGDVFVPDSSEERVGEVFAQSKSELYQLDPFKKTFAKVGDFDCLAQPAGCLENEDCDLGVWDIAVDGHGAMYGAAHIGLKFQLIRIDRANAKCQVVQESEFIGYPNSLSFMPKGTIDTNEEVLVGYSSRHSYVRIDLNTGAMIPLGALNPNPTGRNWCASGDIVGLSNGKAYLTVYPGDDDPDCASLAPANYEGTDYLVEVDPVTGQVMRVIGDTQMKHVWGLGFWAGSAYAFSSSGELAELDMTTAKPTAIAAPTHEASLSFWGAGTTTAAPVVPR